MVPIVEVLSSIVPRVSKKECDGSGCACWFLKINENWGVKLYRDEKTRDKTFNAQQLAATKRLAPKVGHIFHTTTMGEVWTGLYIKENGENKPEMQKVQLEWWGYTTEICPFIAIDGRKLHESGQGDFYEAMRKKRQPLRRKFKKLFGKDWCDDHSGNWGWMDGYWGKRPVIIDFSEV